MHILTEACCVEPDRWLDNAAGILLSFLISSLDNSEKSYLGECLKTAQQEQY